MTNSPWLKYTYIYHISDVMWRKINMSGGVKTRKTRANLEKTDADIFIIEPEDCSSYWYPF